MLKTGLTGILKGLGLLALSTLFTASGAVYADDSLSLVPEAKDYKLVYDLDLSKLGADFVYDVDNSSTLAKPFNRVAYLLELTKDGSTQYVYVSFDALTSDLRKIGVPAARTGASFQRKISNMNVLSNVPGVVSGVGIKSGNIEFWPNNYGPANSKGIPNASADIYDFGDQITDPMDGYGSMQIHNYDAKQTLFAINNWKAGNDADIGIGNCVSGPNSDWTFAKSASSYAQKRLRVLIREGQPAAAAPAKAASADPLAKIPEAKDFELIYDLDLAKLSQDKIVYDVDNRAKTGKFDRIAYLVELGDEDASQYVFASLDAFTADLGKIGVPTASTGASFQQKLANLNVYSNVPGVATGKGISTGNIEFWPNNYGQANGAEIPDASSETFDFGDQIGEPLEGGYGSMQIHNYGAKQTLFAINHWGSIPDLGIGNSPSGNPDWTFAGNGGNFEKKRLRVFVHFVK